MWYNTAQVISRVQSSSDVYRSIYDVKWTNMFTISDLHHTGMTTSLKNVCGESKWLASIHQQRSCRNARRASLSSSLSCSDWSTLGHQHTFKCSLCVYTTALCLPCINTFVPHFLCGRVSSFSFFSRRSGDGAQRRRGVLGAGAHLQGQPPEVKGHREPELTWRQTTGESRTQRLCAHALSCVCVCV